MHENAKRRGTGATPSVSLLHPAAACGLVARKNGQVARSTQILIASFRLVVGLVLWGAVFPLAAAVRFDVFIGYDGILPEASWFPVSFEVQNDGLPFTGIVEFSPGQFNQGQTRLMKIELPKGTLKRFVMPVYSGNRNTYNWSARLVDERDHVRAEALGLRIRKQNQSQTPLAGALARTSAGAPAFPEIKSKQVELSPEVARLQPMLFPDNPIALEGLDTIYLNSEKALDLKVPQMTALLSWLQGGGHLVLGVEQIGDVNGSGWLRPLLPCELTGMTLIRDHGDLQVWVRSDRRRDGWERPYPAMTSENARPNTTRRVRSGGQFRVEKEATTTPNPFQSLTEDAQFEAQPLETAVVGARGDAKVLLGSAEAPLALSAKRGRGLLTVLLFSPEKEPFLSWKNRGYFWAKMVELPPELLVSEHLNYRSYYQSLDSAFGAMIDSKQVRKLPVGWLLLLLLAYLAVIGPLDHYWLKKLNKQMLTWLTFPAYVALFSLLIYLIGYKLRAGETEWNELHLVDVIPNGTEAAMRGRTYASVYSPVNAKYQVASDLPVAALRGEFFGGYGSGQDGTRANIMQKDNSFQAELSVPVWTSQLFVSDWWRRGEAPLTAKIVRNGPLQIEIHNGLGQKLSAKLVLKDEVIDIGELGANQIVKKTLQNGTPLHSFVQTYTGPFQLAVSQRQAAFGGNKTQIQDIPNSAMAASFISRIRETQSSQQPYVTPGFLIPQGMDLSALLDRDEAVLLAWAADYAPVKPLNRFSARRNRHDTLLRLAVEVPK